MSIIIPKEVRKKVASIFEHPNNVSPFILKMILKMLCG